MAYYKYKNKVTDDLEDAYEIIKMVGRALTENKSDKQSTLDNLARAMKKIESARYYVDRE
jgi:chaperonin cofactor prefoldin